MSIEASSATDSRVLRGDPRATPSAGLRKSRMAPALLVTRPDGGGNRAGANRFEPWRLRVGFVSVAGRRSANEDCGYANVSAGIFLVADGVGGHVGGAVASQLLVDTIPPMLIHLLRDGQVPNGSVEQPIRQAVRDIQDALRELAIREPSLAAMGSTIALGVIAGQTLYITHLGDSRVYLVRQGKMTQLTKDHSVVQALIDAGCLTAEKAKQHPLRHVISESVNAKRASPVTVEAHELLPGDRLLFATDGLTDVVEEELLGWTITRMDSPQSAANELVRQALENETKDNVTCLVVHVDPVSADVDTVRFDWPRATN